MQYVFLVIFNHVKSAVLDKEISSYIGLKKSLSSCCILLENDLQ